MARKKSADVVELPAVKRSGEDPVVSLNYDYEQLERISGQFGV